MLRVLSSTASRDADAMCRDFQVPSYLRFATFVHELHQYRAVHDLGAIGDDLCDLAQRRLEKSSDCRKFESMD